MTKQRALFGAILVFSATVLTGCMPKMTIEEMKAMMPERPAELDRLNFLEGTWEATGVGSMAMLDKPITITGQGTGKWECGKTHMVSHGTMTMDGLGDMAFMEIWTYDTKAGKYRTYWFDEMGGSGDGTATYDETTNTWTTHARMNTPHGRMHGKGTMTLKGETSMVWTWRETAMMGLIKVGDYQGTSKKAE